MKCCNSLASLDKICICFEKSSMTNVEEYVIFNQNSLFLAKNADILGIISNFVASELRTFLTISSSFTESLEDLDDFFDYIAAAWRTCE